MTICNRSDASPGRLARRVADAVLADHLKRQLSHNKAEVMELSHSQATMKQKKRRRHHNVRPFNSLRFCAELWSLVGRKLGETSWTLNSRDGIEFGWHDLDFFGFNPNGSNGLVQCLFFAYPLLEFVGH